MLGSQWNYGKFQVGERVSDFLQKRPVESYSSSIFPGAHTQVLVSMAICLLLFPSFQYSLFISNFVSSICYWF